MNSDISLESLRRQALILACERGQRRDWNRLNHFVTSARALWRSLT